MSDGKLGYPVIGLKVALLDGATHMKDSTPMAFELATRDRSRWRSPPACRGCSNR
jgi:translation elongation factor EF-G